MKLNNSLSAVVLAFGLAAAAPVAAQDKPGALGLGIFTFTSGPAAAYGMPGKNADVVARYANRVLVWNAGNIMAEGSPREVFSDARVLQRVVGVA